MKIMLWFAGMMVPLSITMMVLAQEKSKSETIPDVLVTPSCAGEVNFPHKFHFEDLEIECIDCHHETNAAGLNIPHEDYFEDFWIDCLVCHGRSETPAAAQSCSNCHHSAPNNIADETLSAKVVIHKNCWQCHESGTGQEASQSCKFCHQGPKTGH